jgi:hypothetical protein
MRVEVPPSPKFQEAEATPVVVLVNVTGTPTHALTVLAIKEALGSTTLMSPKRVRES